jgi:SOS-response transcriptional repressor LexA
LKIYKGVYVLHPLNDKYSEKIVDSKEIRFIGRAVQKIVRERL